MPLEPGRLSTITGCLNASLNPCATSRAVMSVEAPGDWGTMTRMGLAGYACPEPVEAGCAMMLVTLKSKAINRYRFMAPSP
jgi:hypothetical protein